MCGVRGPGRNDRPLRGNARRDCVYDAHLTAVRQGTGEQLRAASRSVRLFRAGDDCGEGALAVADDGTLAFVQGDVVLRASRRVLPLEQPLFDAVTST